MKLTSQIFSKFWFLIAIGIYSIIFFLPLPPNITSNGIQMIDELIILLACIAIYISFKKKGRGWLILVVVLILTIFTLPLLRIWQSAESNYNLVLGLLPWSDAAGYFSDAISLLQGGLFGAFSGHRPLFAGFLAVLLKIFNGDMQLVALGLTLINGLAVFLFAWEIQEILGPLAAAGMVLLLQFYYRQFSGVFLTEQLGLPLGLLALSGLLYATRYKNIWYFSGGLFLLTVALFARAGAFFVLPTILMVGSVFFKENGRFSLKYTFILLFAILSAWGLNVILGHMVAAPGTVSLGNFSYTLYGQVVGGKGWTQIFKDHPEVNKMADADRTQTIYRLAFNEVVRNPSGLVTGFLSAWKDFFVPSIFAGFSFVKLGDKYSSPIIQTILTIFLFLGLVQSWRRKNQDIYLLLLAITAGIFLSIPFIPPSESANMRIYAGTIAIPALFACIGILTIFKKAGPVIEPDSGLIDQRKLMVFCLGITLVSLSTVGAIMIKTTAQIPSPAPIICQAGEVPIQFQLFQKAYIQINTNETGQQTYVPNVSARDFRQSLRKFPGIYHNFSDALVATITPPVLLTYARNMLTGQSLWLIIQPKLTDIAVGKTIRACGQTDDQGFSVIYINTTK